MTRVDVHAHSHMGLGAIVDVLVDFNGSAWTADALEYYARRLRARVPPPPKTRGRRKAPELPDNVMPLRRPARRGKTSTTWQPQGGAS